MNWNPFFSLTCAGVGNIRWTFSCLSYKSEMPDSTIWYVTQTTKQLFLLGKANSVIDVLWFIIHDFIVYKSPNYFNLQLKFIRTCTAYRSNKLFVRH